LVSRVAGDQNFTLKLSIGSNSLLCAGGIPLLFDKTKLEVVGVDNSANNVVFYPTKVGDNLANYFDFMAVLNPTSPNFWPEVYRDDAAFKAKWGAINILMTSNLEDEENYSVMPQGLEEVINIEFKVKAGAEAGFARIYIDPAFARSAAEKNNSLYFGRGKDAGSFTYYDLLATYGATLDVSADVTVEIFNVILGDTNLNGEVTAADALLTLRAVSGLVVLNEKQILQADVSLSGGAGKITSADALQIRRFVAGLIQEF
ncbi:MAG TPA: dockerin type I repeat-containing protein, partial [Clostridiales bacterium]|nr:dockerin type I repeat-containing protein [Clostridiales bacterium]